MAHIGNLTTTKADLNEAYVEACDLVSKLVVTPEVLDEMFIDAVIDGADRLNTWGEITNKRVGADFIGEDVFIKNSLMAETTRTTGQAVIISSVLVDHLPVRMGGSDPENGPDFLGEVENWGDYTRFKVCEGLDITFMKLSCGESKDEYQNRFDFMNISPNGKGEMLGSIVVPYQSIDYRICTELSECGLLDAFNESLSSIISNVGHDYVYASLKNSKVAEVSWLAGKYNSHDSSKFLEEELWALQTNSAVYDELKGHGFAAVMAEETRGMMDIINQFEEQSSSPEAAAMAGSLRGVLNMHISNFVDGKTTSKAIDKDFNVEKLGKMFEKKRPGNDSHKIRATGEFRDGSYRKYSGFAQNKNIFDLAGESFRAVEEVFEERGDQDKFAEVKEKVEARRAEKDVEIEGLEKGKSNVQEQPKGIE